MSKIWTRGSVLLTPCQPKIVGRLFKASLHIHYVGFDTDMLSMAQWAQVYKYLEATYDQNRVLRRRRRVHNLWAQAQDRTDRHWTRKRDAIKRQELDMALGEHARIGKPKLCDWHCHRHQSSHCWTDSFETHLIGQAHEVSTKNLLMNTAPHISTGIC